MAGARAVARSWRPKPFKLIAKELLYPADRCVGG